MEAEKDLQVGCIIVEEMANVERECAHREQEDDDKHIGERRREIGRKFALENSNKFSHVRTSRARFASWVVIARNTSSRRPGSAYNSFTSHFSAVATPI